MNANLRGSKLNDAFRQRHKVEAPKDFYGADLDFVLIRKDETIAGFLDVKRPGEAVTWAEGVMYTRLQKMASVYLVVTQDSESGPFTVRKWWPGARTVNGCPVVWEAEGWPGLVAWEARIRGVPPP